MVFNNGLKSTFLLSTDNHFHYQLVMIRQFLHKSFNWSERQSESKDIKIVLY